MRSAFTTNVKVDMTCHDILQDYCFFSVIVITFQVESLSKLKMVNELIKSKPQSTVKQEDLLKMMGDILKQEVSAGSLVHFLSPLSPSYMLQEPR